MKYILLIFFALASVSGFANNNDPDDNEFDDDDVHHEETQTAAPIVAEIPVHGKGYIYSKSGDARANGRTFQGLSIATDLNTPVHAIFAGRVSKIEQYRDGGWT